MQPTQNDPQAGIGLLEVLFAATILLIVMLGMNAALIASSMVSLKSKDITWATNLAQQLLEDEKRKCVNPLYFANLPASTKASLYTVMGANDAVLKRYALLISTRPPSVVTTRATNPGNNVVVKINVPPSMAGIVTGSRVTLFWPATGARQTVYVLNPNDAATQFQVDDTAPAQGRQGLLNTFPEGSYVVVGSKLLTVQLGYSASNGSDGFAVTRTPLMTLSAYVNNPMQ